MNTDGRRTSQLYLAADMADVVLHEIAGGTVCVQSTRCPGNSSSNEDAAAVVPLAGHAGVLAVADGMGGAAAGAQASAIALQALKAAIDEAERTGAMLRTAILNGFESANRQVRQFGCGAATTLAVVEIQENEVRPYHVGDSAILVVGQRGRIKLQSVAHSPVGYAVQAGVLDEREAIDHEDRHVVFNAVGTVDMRIEIGSPMKLARRDTVLLASDGLTDNLHVHEIVEVIRKGPLGSAGRTLADRSLHRMSGPGGQWPSKPDDLTFMLFRL